MFKQKFLPAAIFAVLVFVSYPHETLSEGFTSEKFLEWDRKSQNSLIQASIMMIGIVATQTHKSLAPCIDRWYAASDESSTQRRHDELLAVMRKNPQYHPQAVILAVLQKQCGSFKDRK